MTRKRNVIWLGVVSFINDTASEIIIPLLPFFITAIGGTGFAVGLISGVGESIAGMFKVAAGYWSDRLNKRIPFIFSGYLIAQVSKILLAIASVWPHVLILRATERLGKGIRSAPRDSLLAGSTDKKTRGKWFGVHRAFDSGGAILGTLLAFLFYYLLKFDFTLIFLIAGGIGFFSLIPLIFVRDYSAAIPEAKKKFTLQLKGFSSPLKMFFAVATLFALANFSYMFFVLKAKDFFGGLLSVGAPILLYTLYNISYTAMAIPAGKLSDRIGRRPVLIIGYALFAATSLGFEFADAVWQLIALFVLYGVCYAFVNATERAYVSDLAPEHARGTALGSYHTLVSLGALPAGLIAGLLWDVNHTYTFIYGAVMSLAAVLLFLMSQRGQRLRPTD